MLSRSLRAFDFCLRNQIFTKFKLLANKRKSRHCRKSIFNAHMERPYQPHILYICWLRYLPQRPLTPFRKKALPTNPSFTFERFDHYCGRIKNPFIPQNTIQSQFGSSAIDSYYFPLEIQVLRPTHVHLSCNAQTIRVFGALLSFEQVSCLHVIFSIWLNWKRYVARQEGAILVSTRYRVTPFGLLNLIFQPLISSPLKSSKAFAALLWS